MIPPRTLALATALACAGTASAAGSSAPQILPLAPSAAKSSLADKKSLRAPEARSHHDLRGTLMPDGSVRIECDQVAGSIERSRRIDARVPTEAK